MPAICSMKLPRKIDVATKSLSTDRRDHIREIRSDEKSVVFPPKLLCFRITRPDEIVPGRNTAITPIIRVVRGTRSFFRLLVRLNMVYINPKKFVSVILHGFSTLQSESEPNPTCVRQESDIIDPGWHRRCRSMGRFKRSTGALEQIPPSPLSWVLLRDEASWQDAQRQHRLRQQRRQR